MHPSARIAALAIAAFAAACATSQREPPPKPFAGTHWNAVLELPPAGEKPWVRFGDGRMEGFGGCNRIAARYVQDSVGARAIAIGRIEKGFNACDRSTGDAEDRFLEVLQSVSSYSIVGDAMAMTGSAGTVRFRAAGGEAKK
ncbi:MAG TPA: META domain-containing protein [Usitatibacter sp.]|jgi:heat shock protein HslJ|nr:META domain-containing protein [Usitatibacter sp.]